MALPVTKSPEGLAVRAHHLGMTFGEGRTEVCALSDIELLVPVGQFVSVMGPSGSGKSTLLHLLAGLRRPTSGQVWVGERDIGAMSDDEAARFRRRNVGLVFQFFNLIPTLSVVQNICVPLLLEGHRLRTLHDRVDELLGLLGIQDRKGHALSELSGGEIQRVAIARALIAEPRVVLADEPTGNLDSRTGDEILSLVSELSRRRRATVIMMTHDEQATSYSDRVLTLRDGRIVEDSEGSAELGQRDA